MKNLRLRTKLLAIAVPPLAILAVLVVYALKLTYLDQGSVDGAAMQQDLRVLGIVGLAGVLGSALALVLVTRSVTGPLDRLTRAADELSSTRLPALVEQLRDPNAARPAPAELLGLDSDDELGRLARALDGVQAVAAEVTAAQQGLVREGLSTLVINLARRNQALLERQLSFIDQLEIGEHDPDRLEDLYRLDHLATRMRRNAESLLVLAGAEPPRRRGAPVHLVDVIRAAIGEIEDYRHVELGGINDVEVGSNVAVDLAHLLSELMENATQFSPPEAPVVVDGGRTADGSYAISVQDHGIGMGDGQLAEANRLLATPPELGLDLSRSLGFLVMGRLAKRLGATVQLRRSAGQGITASVVVPAELVTGAGPGNTGDLPVVALPAASPTGVPVRPALPPTTPRIGVAVPSRPQLPADPLADAPAEPPAGSSSDLDEAPTWPTTAVGNEPVFDGPAPADLPSDLPAAVDADAWWSHPSQQAPAPPPAPGLLDELRRSGGPRHLAEALPEGEDFDRGVSSLLAPDLAPAVPLADPPIEPVRTEAGLVRRRRGEQAPPEQTSRPVTASSRTPEEIREMLARYRSGIKHRRPAGSAPNEETTR